MEKYFDIRYEFSVPQIHRAIEEQVARNCPDYICVADGNILNMVYHDSHYRDVINGGMFSICDSSWVPQFIKCLAHNAVSVFTFNHVPTMLAVFRFHL